VSAYASLIIQIFCYEKATYRHCSLCLFVQYIVDLTELTYKWKTKEW
jgi:hypothetical protein